MDAAGNTRSGDPETKETAEKMLDLLCQRNRALAALILAEPLIGRDADDWRDGYSVQAATANRAVSKAIAACEKGGA